VDDYSAEGRWWLPGKGDRAAVGSFAFRGGGASLTVYEPLVPADEVPENPVHARWVTYPVVHGRTNAGEDVTLFVARSVEFPHGSSGSKSTFHVEAAALGRHLDSDAFSAVSFELDYLPSWLCPPTLVDDHDFHTLTVKLDPRILVEANVGDACVRIETMMTGEWQPGVTLQQTTSVIVEFPQPVSYKVVVNRYVRAFEDLLTLCLDLRVCLVRLMGAASGDGERARDATLFFANAGLSPTMEPRFADIIGMGSPTLLSGYDTPLEMKELVERWFGVYENLGSALVLLLGRHYAPFMYAEHELGSTVNAAEALHSLRFDSRQREPQAHQRRVRAVVEAATKAGVDPADLEWAERVLKNANSKPLKRRLEELLEASGDVGREILAVEPEFCGEVVGLRVAAAHGNATSRAKLSHAGRFRHEQALRWVVRCFLVGELLGDHAEAQRRTMVKESFKFAVRRLADPEGTD